MKRKRIGRVIAFQTIYVEWTGSVTAALMLSQLIYWEEKGDEDGWIFKTMKEWQEETGLTPDEQYGARKKLRKSRLVEEKLAGQPARLFYRVVDREYRERINAHFQLEAFPLTSQGKSLTLARGFSPHSHDTTYHDKKITERDSEVRARIARPKTSHSFGLNGDEHTAKSTTGEWVKQFDEFRISHRLHLGKAKPNLRKWEQVAQELLDQLDGDTDRIQLVLDWYFLHWKDPWVVHCQALTTFCADFFKIEKAMLREQGATLPKKTIREFRSAQEFEDSIREGDKVAHAEDES